MDTNYSIRYKEPQKETRLYCIWKRMKSRCNNPKKDHYKYYGGKGIEVCKEWSIRKYGYENFYNWSMTHGYKENLTLDRQDSAKGYSPDNCRWVTGLINGRYKSSTKLNVEAIKEIRRLYKTGNYTYKTLSKLFNVENSNIYQIVKNKRWKDVNDSEMQYDRNKGKEFTYNTEKNNLDKYKKYTTQETINKIHEMYKTMRVIDISNKLNIKYNRVRYIIHNRSWKSH